MNDYIDISLTISPDLPVWPGVPKVRFETIMDVMEGDIATDHSVFFNIHTGTHVDAPSHFIASGATIENLPIDVFLGPVIVKKIPETFSFIDSAILENLNIPEGTLRLLFHTRNSRYWESGTNEFQPDFVALTADGAQWLVDRAIKLVGIDYLSIQRFIDGPATHQILLSAGVVVLEGLNLSQVEAGEYDLICLPLKFHGLEGAPARAILKGPKK